MSGAGPVIELSVILREMRFHMAEAFSAYEGQFQKEAIAALEQAMSDKNIARLFKEQADNFVKDIIEDVFRNWELKRTIAKKVADALAQKMKE